MSSESEDWKYGGRVESGVNRWSDMVAKLLAAGFSANCEF
jgi:hypothetical protein